ncbi:MULTISPECIES: hypothetical protein [Streptomyces]|uniref:Uncharacterized protein n=1 Tax=Streptomyces achromogenes TaxID=67255 RepID=A0ABU0QCT8_STRAH|nr:hypothetical protein [Streptomyces achromogenes]MDQ0688476.1 hypothetical protein [Streptomyces achromogenes]MDQ0835668.1 hypothetical protein [Streptomyces achromogenes]
MRNATHRTRRAVALGLATAALGSALTLAGSGAATAQPIPPSGPSQSNNGGGPSGVSGSVTHPDPEPHDMVQGTDFWRDMGWPNWHNIGNQHWFTGASWVDPARRTQVREIVYTGGQYQDRDGRLRAFLNAGLAGTSARGYTGTFQEYNTTVYVTPANGAAPRRDARRVVRAINTGDVWWTNDHYSTFHYMGRP